MRQEKTNTWKDGLNLDLHPMVTPNTVLTDCLNGTFITYNGNEFCLQNNRGNKDTNARITNGYTPIGIKEHNGILYIVSVKPNYNENNEIVNYTTEIGTYKSPDWTSNPEMEHELIDEYSPLKNFATVISGNYYGFYTPLFFPKKFIDPDECCVECYWQNLEGYRVYQCMECSNNTSATSWLDDESLYEGLNNAIISNVDGYNFDENTLIKFNTLQEKNDAVDNIKNILSGYGDGRGTFQMIDQNNVARFDYWEDDPMGIDFTACTFNYNTVLIPKPTDYNYRSEFRTTVFNFDINHPVTIEIQDSYDGSVNLIMTDTKHETRIVNSGFSVLPNNRCKIVARNQDTATNVYFEDTVDSVTKLIKNPVSFAYFDLDSVTTGGQLKGGNYTFYAKYGDSDGNQTDICAESSVVSIFKGSVDSPKTISGTLGDERTDKLISLVLHNLNRSYDKIYLYAVREYSDTAGYLMTEAFAFEKPFDIITLTGENDSVQYICNITLTGIENTTSISIEDLNISYQTVNSTKTIAQQQDMLFLGNVTKQQYDYQHLSTFAKYIKTNLCRKDDSKGSDEYDVLSPVSFKYETTGEYYDTSNIYYKVGYYPGEYYRFGIVFMFENGSMSNVFNMYGGAFSDFNSPLYMITNPIDNTTTSQPYWNEYGVFRMPMENPNTKIIQSSGVIPWHVHFDFTSMIEQIQQSDYADKIVGCFIVRQKRIPEVITQGLQTGIEYYNHVPLSIIPSKLFDGGNENFAEYGTESFVTIFDTGNDSKTLYIPETTDGQILADYNDYEIYRIIKVKSWAEGWTTEPRIKTYYAKMHYIQGINGTVTSILKTSPSSIDSRDGCTVWFDPRDPVSIRTSRITRNDATRISSSTYNRAEKKYILYPNDSQVTDKILKSFLEGKYANDENYISGDSSTYSFKDWVRTWGVNSTGKHDSGYKINVDSKSSALLTLDPILVPETRNMLNGTDVTIEAVGAVSKFAIGGRHIDMTSTKYDYDPYNSTNASAAYIGSENYGKVVGSSTFASIVGNAYDSSKYGYLGYFDGTEWKNEITSTRYDRVIRGLYTSYVGLTLGLYMGSDESPFNTRSAISGLIDNNVYKYNPALILQLSNRTDPENAFLIRQNDNSEYYVVSNRIPLTTTNAYIYRGDCYSTTQTVRIIRNFINADSPYTEAVLKKDSWTWANINPNDPNWDNVNIGDLDTVALGHWITFKCLSNYNIGLRSTDPFDVSETAIMGNEKSFYPLTGSTATANKIADSTLLNAGYSKSVGRKRYEQEADTPYIKSEFSNRVMFSNKNVTDQFINGYRTFQGLAYHDYDKQYGEIIKLLPWDNNLFCVFEHGLAILPINEKALMQTTTDQTIHIYGHGVLPDTMTIISPDYGSKYADSVIRTPIGIYGLDTCAKKIWRFSKNNGFETLSDMKVETWLQDYIENEYSIEIKPDKCTNVRTEYDSLKGDIIFSVINDGALSSITFNERQNLWVTKNDWYPTLTENVNGEMYSLSSTASPAAYYGIYKHDPNTQVTQWYGNQHPFEFEFVVSDPIGVHKIIDNLQIISNNCQPEELSFEIIGDSYMFNKEKLRHLGRGENSDIDVVSNNRNESDILNKYPDPNFPSTSETANAVKNSNDANYLKNKAKLVQFSGTTRSNDIVRSSEYFLDKRTNQYHLHIPQECRNIETWGRRIGNIHYSEDSWYTNVEPIRFDAELLSKNPSTMSGVIREARIRDKWCKIRVRYTGEDLAVISAIKTMINI